MRTNKVVLFRYFLGYPETKNLTLFSAIYHVENAKPEAHVKINSSDVLSKYDNYFSNGYV